MKLFYPFKQRFLEVLKFVEEANYLPFVWPVSTNLQSNWEIVSHLYIRLIDLNKFNTKISFVSNALFVCQDLFPTEYNGTTSMSTN